MYVAWILLCESCKFGEKICYNNWDNEFFLRDCFLLAHPVYITSKNLRNYNDHLRIHEWPCRRRRVCRRAIAPWRAEWRTVNRCYHDLHWPSTPSQVPGDSGWSSRPRNARRRCSVLQHNPLPSSLINAEPPLRSLVASVTLCVRVPALWNENGLSYQH